MMELGWLWPRTDLSSSQMPKTRTKLGGENNRHKCRQDNKRRILTQFGYEMPKGFQDNAGISGGTDRTAAQPLPTPENTRNSH